MNKGFSSLGQYNKTFTKLTKHAAPEALAWECLQLLTSARRRQNWLITMIAPTSCIQVTIQLISLSKNASAAAKKIIHTCGRRMITMKTGMCITLGGCRSGYACHQSSGGEDLSKQQQRQRNKQESIRTIPQFRGRSQDSLTVNLRGASSTQWMAL